MSLALRGRPSIRTLEIERAIIDGLSRGVPLTVICAEEGMPTDRTVRLWQDADEEFSSAIAHAREAGHDALAAECLEIADHAAEDTYEDEDGVTRTRTEVIQRSKLRVDTRLKLLAKWDPKRYGDKLDITSDGKELGLAAELEAARQRAAQRRLNAPVIEGEFREVEDGSDLA